MDAELKTLLTVLLDKVERIEAQMPLLVTRRDLELVREELRPVKDEQRQMKEMPGDIWQREISRLDGRIDQLAMDVALGRKPAAE